MAKTEKGQPNVSSINKKCYLYC